MKVKDKRMIEKEEYKRDNKAKVAKEKWFRVMTTENDEYKQPSLWN
ncbi:MAG: hypothetical protein QMC40_03800 [Vicingaceae bacterium]|jgi:hypothetical protein|tara:strand:+ start:383 stop:520 length:138 start_codon:yes stop_codon:yes gene_type:complete